MDNIDFVLWYAKMYKCKTEDRGTVKRTKVTPDTNSNGYSWYEVGHNASHSFFLAVDDNGKIWKRSFCVDTKINGMDWREYCDLLNSDNEEDRERAYAAEETVVDECIYEVSQSSIGYIGHW